MVLLKLAVCLLLIIAFAGVKGQEVGVPINTVAVLEDTAKLHCRYHFKSCLQIRWQKISASRHVMNISDGNRIHDNRYRLDNSSECVLVIQNVQLTDSGTFICTIPGYDPGLADLIVLHAEPSCSTSCEEDKTAENEKVDFKCELTYSGGGTPVVTWWNNLTKLELAGVTPARRVGSTISRDFSRNAGAPAVPPLFCMMTFHFDQRAGRASNVPKVTCDTDSCKILYSVRNVVTWPLLYASPGEQITCRADGNPDPTFEWQWKEQDGEWEDVPDATSETTEASLNNGASTQLRCVANNTVNEKEYSENSPEVTVTKHGALIRTAIIVGVIVAIAIVAIIAGVIYKFCFE